MNKEVTKVEMEVKNAEASLTTAYAKA